MALSAQMVSAALRAAGWMPTTTTRMYQQGIHVKKVNQFGAVRVAVEIDTPGYRAEQIPMMMHALNRVGYQTEWTPGHISFYVTREEE